MKMQNYREQLYKKNKFSAALMLKQFLIICLFPDEVLLTLKS